MEVQPHAEVNETTTRQDAAITGFHADPTWRPGLFPGLLPASHNAVVSFTVLYVCTGNLCRSPMAELLFRGWADPAADVEVSSAGLEAVVGHGIDASSATALAQLGIDPSQHRARQFEPWMAAYADLILTANREHRDRVMTELPVTFRRAFTMKEFPLLAARVQPGEARAVVAAAAAERGRGEPINPEDMDVRDPYRRAVPHAKTIAEEITESVYATLYALGFAAKQWAHTPPVRENRSARPAPF
jgi:low molecular weight protein-tyrosine phosphatase